MRDVIFDFPQTDAQSRFCARGLLWALVFLSIAAWQSSAFGDGKSIFDDNWAPATRPVSSPSATPAPDRPPQEPPARPIPVNIPAVTPPVPRPVNAPPIIPLPATPMPAPQPVKMPAPDMAGRAAVMKQVKEVFDTDYADRTVSGRRALARKLLAEALKIENNYVARYVLLEEAQTDAVAVGDVDTCEKAIDGLEEHYAIDSAKLTIDALTKLQMTGPEDAVCSFGVRAIAQMMDAGNYEAVSRLLQAGRVKFSRSKDPATRASLNTAEAIVAEYQRILPALERLKTDPADPAGNLAAGIFYCFYKHDFALGLPMLAHGNDAVLKDAAEKDLANPSDATARFQLAGAWWALGEQKARLPLQQAIRERASYWYSLALPELNGLSKMMAERRLAAAPPPAASRAGAPGPVAVSDNNILPSMRATGQTTAVADGALQISRGRLKTPDDISVPFRADFVAKTDSTNIRLGYAHGMVIFDWELNPTELRHHDPATGRIAAVRGKGEIPVEQYAQITWILKPDSSTILVNGEERAVLHGDYAGLRAPVSIFPANGSTITVKSVMITQAEK